MSMFVPEHTLRMLAMLSVAEVPYQLS